MSFENIWSTILNWFKTTGADIGIMILQALAIYIIGTIVIKIILKIVKDILNKTTFEKITQTFFTSILKLVLQIVMIIMIINTFGVATTSLLALLATAGLAIGLSLQSSLSNIANGVIIVSTKPFKVGDYVKIGEVEGSVKAIKVFTTIITTFDNKETTIPNSMVISSSVVNYSKNSVRRIDFLFSVAYESDVEKVKKIILDVMNSSGLIKLTPIPFVSLKKLDASSIDFAANCWCDNEDYWTVYYYVMDKVFNEFKRGNVSVPYNQMEVRLRNEEVKNPYNKTNLPARVEKIKETEFNYLNLLKADSELPDLTTTFLNIKKQKAKKTSKKNSRKNSKPKKSAEIGNSYTVKVGVEDKQIVLKDETTDKNTKTTLKVNNTKKED